MELITLRSSTGDNETGRNVAKKLCKCLSESNNIHTIVTDRILTLIPDGPEGEHVGGLGEG